MIGKKKTNEEFLKELREVHGDNIEALEEYINIDAKIKFRCNIDAHEWETIPYTLLIGSGCPCCSGRTCVEEINSVYKLRPDLIKYFKNIDDAKTHTLKSGEYVNCQCPECGFEKKIKICNLSNYNFHCDYCSDKISLPNRFIATLLKSIDIDFKLEKIFSWSQKKKYDVYIANYKGESIVIENQGIQHDKGGFENLGGRTLEEEQKNDRIKKELALQNGIKEKNYIEVNFYNQYSTLENFKNSVLDSSLNELFDIKDIDWYLVWEECQKSLIIQVWQTWNIMDRNIRSTVSVGKLYGIHRQTVAKYLKLGVEIGKVEYNPLEEQKTFEGRCGDEHPNSKKVVCLNTGEIFESISLANKEHRGSIYECCKGILKSCGKLDDGTKTVWRYYEEYCIMTSTEIEQIIETANEKITPRNKLNNKIVCLNTREIFYSSQEAGEKINIINPYNIELCCRQEYLSCGKINDEKLVWRYYDEYIGMTKCEIEKVILQANDSIKGGNHYKSKNILCLNTNMIFNSQKEAGEYYGIKSYNNIGMCCRGERKYCGKLSTGKKLEWMYCEDNLEIKI